jgi:hypothetical protein
MVLNTEQTKQLLNEETTYDCKFAKFRFGYEFFQQETSSFGSILCFEFPTQLGKFKFQNAINICIELPNYSSLATICFERLFLTQIGSILSNTLQTDCFVNENTLFIDEKQLCVTLIKDFNNSALLHITIPTVTKYKQFSKIDKVDSATKNKIMEDIVNSFRFLTKSIFLESQRNII